MDRFVRVVLRMRHDSSTCKPYHEPSLEWCCRLEELVGFPYQYYWRNGSSDDLVLVFRRTNLFKHKEMTFDANKDFLDLKLIIKDVTSQNHYCDANFELTEQDRCPHKLCCKYYNEPDGCYYKHTPSEIKHLSENGPLQREKLRYCLRYADQEKCPETAENCRFAHGEDYALCSNCGKTGHFEYYCDDNHNHKTVKLENAVCMKWICCYEEY